MKRKENEEVPKKKKTNLSEEKLANIYKLVSEGKSKQARRLIPVKIRHHVLRLKDGTNIQRYGKSPLLNFVAQEGSCDLLECLLDGGADIERREPYGDTPLVAAARNGNNECCELLINRGANIEARCSAIGDTSLIAASIRGETSTCKLLLRRGANINACNNLNRSALYHAVACDRISVVKLLLSEGARFYIDYVNGYTPLDLAIKQNKPEIVSLFENHLVTTNLSGIISRGLTDGFEFSDFLVKGICDARLFIIVAKFAYN